MARLGGGNGSRHERLRAAVLLSSVRLLVSLRDANIDAMLALDGGALKLKLICNYVIPKILKDIIMRHCTKEFRYCARNYRIELIYRRHCTNFF